MTQINAQYIVMEKTIISNTNISSEILILNGTINNTLAGTMTLSNALVSSDTYPILLNKINEYSLCFGQVRSRF